MIFISCLRRTVIFSFGYFIDSLNLEQLSACHKRGVPQWVKPATQHAQDVLLGGEAS